IDDENGTPTGVALRSGELARELAPKAPPVEEPGERVMVGEVRELPLEQLAFRNVLDLVDAVQGRARIVAYQRRVQHDPQHFTVGADEALLELVAGDLVLKQLTHQLKVFCDVSRVRERLKRRSPQLRLRIAGEFAQSLIDVQEAPVALRADVHERHPDR